MNFMKNIKKNIEEFFGAYETHFNLAVSGMQADINGVIRKSFADCFVESSPLGVICGKNDDEFLNRIQEGFNFYRNIGSKGMKIRSKDVTVLDDFHAITKVQWRYSYLKDNVSGAIDFDVFYLLRIVNHEVKIFGYISGDEQKALRERGLIPEEHEHELVPSQEL
jgi:hypothetical protein